MSGSINGVEPDGNLSKFVDEQDIARNV